MFRTLDEIKADGTVNIGVFSDKNPFGYVDENGEYQGYDVYFARRLAEDLGVEANFVSTEAANRIEYLQTGKVDIILANFTVTPERAEEVDFALPYMNVALGVISPDSNVITSLDNWNADRVRMTEFIDLAKRYTDFSELTTPILNEFIEKIVVHEGNGRGKQRRQRLDFYFNFIGAFEVPADIVTPMEQEEERRQQEEQAEKEERSQVLAQVRYERYKQERREFTARKRAGLLTPEEQAEEERRLERNRAYQQKQRDKKKASQPEKPRKRSLKELAKLDGADLTPEEAERLAAHRQKKAEQHKAWRDRQKSAQPPKPQQRTLKELARCAEAGLPLTLEEAERLEAHRNRKKAALQDLKARAETDPVAAAELAQQRAQQSEAVKKSRQKMYADAAAGDPEAQARYERMLAARRENYHRKKQAEAEAAQVS